MPTATSYPYAKGHGTENDFVLLPDPDGALHGDLDPARVRALCDRQSGLGADGVLRVIRTAAYAGPDAADLPPASDAEWFMDYRNSDGSLSEMCGNGIRVFARYLVEEGLADPAQPIPIATRDGIKQLVVAGESITADLGSPFLLGSTTVALGQRSWPAAHVDLGNPHAVVFLPAGSDLTELGPVLVSPGYDEAVYPHGVNVEFVVRREPQHVAMRVHERGSGETRSCGTGACAVMVAAAVADGLVPGVDGPPEQDISYRVDVPGGQLTVTWTTEDQVLLTGPAVVVDRGTAAY